MTQPIVATGIYSAKGAFFDRLTFLQSQGHLVDVTIAYDQPPADAQLKCIYGGGVRFTHEDLMDNYGTLISEDASFAVYLRVTDMPPSSVRETDVKVATLARELVSLMVDHTDLGAGHTWRGIGRGQGDYLNTSDATTSIMALEIKVGSQFSYIGG